MSQLEGRSKRVLSLMSQGKTTPLLGTEQRLMAAWAVETPMVMQLFAYP